MANWSGEDVFNYIDDAKSGHTAQNITIADLIQGGQIIASTHANSIAALSGYDLSVFGGVDCSFGVLGSSERGISVQGLCGENMAPLRLQPSGSSAAPVHESYSGSFWFTNTDIHMYVNTSPGYGTSWTRVLYEDDTQGLTNIFNADDYTGSDTQKIQAAIDDAEAVKGTVFIGSRVWQVGAGDGGSMPLTITAAIKVVGSGNGTIIHSQDRYNHIFKIACDEAVYIQDMQITYAGAVIPVSIGSSCIYVTDADGDSDNQASRFDRLTLQYGHYGIHFYRAFIWTVNACHFLEMQYIGCLVENHHNSDQGDSTFTNSLITGQALSHAGIQYNSSGGLKFANNKINAFFDYNIDMYAEEYGGSGGLNSWIIVGNSLEGAEEYSIRLRPNSSIPCVGTITGNEIVGNKGGVYIEGGISARIFGITIVGNNFHNNGNPTGVSQIYIDRASNILVNSNLLRGNGTATYGIKVGTATTNIKIGLNHYVDFTVGYEINGSGIVPNQVLDGGTGLMTIADGSILAANSANVLSAITWHGTGYRVLANSSGTVFWDTGLLKNIVEDTTPQLGGPLEMNGYYLKGDLEATSDYYVRIKGSNPAAGHYNVLAVTGGTSGMGAVNATYKEESKSIGIHHNGTDGYLTTDFGAIRINSATGNVYINDKLISYGADEGGYRHLRVPT